ncbi:type II toxin-antitoxin system PemK/MazF family toxin [Eisenibacter elegans]|jgi:mRNA interferase MazF|uniref:type II toxin-antitoxin system PemK/MazF family toxin n=1 Tax=Eisenibacter elegans TaxID=997 RepID=UPI0005581888|nr:type II toxin-antitoxin system PemK/MazF family toxin [Eisenibacter elegans]
MITFLQYEIVVINLDPTVGSEIKKKRPCLIVSPNEMNKHLATVVVCPITSQSKKYPTRVSFDLEGQESWIVIDQICTIDKSRVTKTIGHLEDEIIEQVKAIIKEAYVD